MAKMKAFASFEEYLGDQEPGNQAVIRGLRQFVSAAQPRLREDVKWGNGCWVAGNSPVAYVHAEDSYVQFGFFRGSELDDPGRLLDGKGKYVRHIKVADPKDIDEEAFGVLLAQACEQVAETRA
jgi:hypothetical protein